MLVTDEAEAKETVTSEIAEKSSIVVEDTVESIPIETAEENVVEANNKVFVNMAMAEVAMVEQPPILSKLQYSNN